MNTLYAVIATLLLLVLALDFHQCYEMCCKHGYTETAKWLRDDCKTMRHIVAAILIIYFLQDYLGKGAAKTTKPPPPSYEQSMSSF